MTRHGWLAGRNIEPVLNGISFDPAMPTRREEFALALEASRAVPAGRVLDAGSGITPDQHVLPLILAADGWRVTALDHDPVSLKMPTPENVERVVMDMGDITLDGPFDMVVSISVLEHLDDAVQQAFAAHAARLCKPGGLLVVTADLMERLPDLFTEWFDVGEAQEQPDELTQPSVYYVIGRRR